jgi:hypothetical protein
LCTRVHLRGSAVLFSTRLCRSKQTSTANSHERRLQSDLAVSRRWRRDVVKSHVFLAVEPHGTHRSIDVYGSCYVKRRKTRRAAAPSSNSITMLLRHLPRTALWSWRRSPRYRLHMCAKTTILLIRYQTLFVIDQKLEMMICCDDFHKADLWLKNSRT